MPLVTSAVPGWQDQIADLPSGDHIAVLTGTHATGIVGRVAGLELRDALAVLLPGPGVGLVFLFRKPVSEPTVAAQMLKTGTGGLNIGACRVGLSGGTKRSGQAEHFYKDDGTEDRSAHWARTGHTVVELEGTGRWPPNILLVHADRCQRAGTRQIHGTGHWPKARGVGGVSTTGHGGQDALIERDADETIADWECVAGCPAPILDTLSGERPVSGVAKAGNVHKQTPVGYSGGGYGATSILPNDSGGASRFFPQFESMDALEAWLTRLVGGTVPALVV